MYRASFGVWEDGSGWQAHQIKDRTADTMEDLLRQIRELELYADDTVDYQVTVFCRGEVTDTFWISETLPE